MPQTLTEIREELAARGIRPKHKFGQNFLHDHNQLRKLLSAANVQPGELVLEVGPGTGTLTETLMDAGCEVVACELDRDMAEIVRSRNAHRMGAAPGKVTIVEADCLDGKHALGAKALEALAGRPFVLVANLPYQAATPLMATLLERHPECRGQFVTIQREVGDRLMAKAGDDADKATGLSEGKRRDALEKDFDRHRTVGYSGLGVGGALLAAGGGLLIFGGGF